MKLLALFGAAMLVTLLSFAAGLFLGWLEVRYERRIGLKRRRK